MTSYTSRLWRQRICSWVWGTRRHLQPAVKPWWWVAIIRVSPRGGEGALTVTSENMWPRRVGDIRGYVTSSTVSSETTVVSALPGYVMDIWSSGSQAKSQGILKSEKCIICAVKKKQQQKVIKNSCVTVRASLHVPGSPECWSRTTCQFLKPTCWMKDNRELSFDSLHSCSWTCTCTHGLAQSGEGGRGPMDPHMGQSVLPWG